MKKLALLFIINCLMINGYSQKIFSSVKDIYTASTLTFYGYDYTQLKIADGTRIGQPLKKFFPTLTKFLEDKIPQKKMKGMVKKKVLNVNFIPTGLINETINNDKIVTETPQTFTVDALPAFINKYQLEDKEGIGYVIIFECFDRAAKTVSAYLVFFDISTKNILHTQHTSSFDRNGYNYMIDWKIASMAAVERLFKSYNAEKKASQKAEIKPEEK